MAVAPGKPVGFSFCVCFLDFDIWLLNFLIFISESLLFKNSFHGFHLFSLHLHDSDSFLEVLLEAHDSILVGIELGGFLVLVDFKRSSELLEYFHWSLLWKFFEEFIYFTFASRESFEFDGIGNVLIF